jgi:uncharacterized protein (TIGR02996 family)
MPPTRASEVAHEIATVLDDNLNVPVAEVLRFEIALADNPADSATRQVYHDWLLDHGCSRRAEQLTGELDDMPPVYEGEVRPQNPPYDWAGL